MWRRFPWMQQAAVHHSDSAILVYNRASLVARVLLGGRHLTLRTQISEVGALAALAWGRLAPVLVWALRAEARL